VLCLQREKMEGMDGFLKQLQRSKTPGLIVACTATRAPGDCGGIERRGSKGCGEVRSGDNGAILGSLAARACAGDITTMFERAPRVWGETPGVP
jgi:hypothetical protein